MKKKVWLSALIVVASLNLTGCASTGTPRTMVTVEEVKAAKTKADHLALAAKYEMIAQEMQIQAYEQKKILQSSTARPYEVGRNVEDVEEHSRALIDAYQKSADFNLKMAKIHRDTASELH